MLTLEKELIQASLKFKLEEISDISNLREIGAGMKSVYFRQVNAVRVLQGGDNQFTTVFVNDIYDMDDVEELREIILTYHFLYLRQQMIFAAWAVRGCRK
jgi:hypothetical protein